jgi:hypothetical protein
VRVSIIRHSPALLGPQICALPGAENGGVRADSAIPCSSIITHGPRSSAQQLHWSVHPLDTVARVATSLRAPL